MELQAGNGSTVNFQTDAFNEACVKETGANLNYVILTTTPAAAAICTTSTASPASLRWAPAVITAPLSPLDQVSFVPGSGTGSSVRIPFEGEATNGKSFYGEVKLTYVTLSEPTIITYTSTGLAVDFNAADFTAACAAPGRQGPDLRPVPRPRHHRRTALLQLPHSHPVPRRGGFHRGLLRGRRLPAGRGHLPAQGGLQRRCNHPLCGYRCRRHRVIPAPFR